MTFRDSTRMLSRAPAYCANVILTVALGVGLATAMFTLVNSILLRPLAYPDSDELVVLTETGTTGGGVSWPNIMDWESQNTVFEGIAVSRVRLASLLGTEEPLEVSVGDVSLGYFEIMGIEAIAGRRFTGTDGSGAERSVVLSEEFAVDKFGSAREAIGEALRVGTDMYSVVGVVPRGSVGSAVQLWRPIESGPDRTNRESRLNVAVFARMKSGVTIARARAEMQTISQRLQSAHPANIGRSVRVELLKDVVVQNAGQLLYLMLGASGLVLLLGCLNVAGLQLARGANRTAEVATRIALGASRSRVVRQLLFESLILAALGGLCGVLLAFWSADMLVYLLPGSMPRQHEIGADAAVLLFGAATTALSTVLVAAMPALLSSRIELYQALRGGQRTLGGRRRQLFWSSLIVLQLAFTVVLLTGAGLLGKSIYRLLSVPTGFSEDETLVFDLNLPVSRYVQAQQQSEFYQQILSLISLLPQVSSVATTSDLPIGRVTYLRLWAADERPAQTLEATYSIVSPDYFRSLGIPLLEGRDFTPADRAGTPLVAVISQEAAQRGWPHGSALGKALRFGIGPNAKSVKVIGIAGDVRRWTRDGFQVDSFAHIYVPYPQDFSKPVAALLVRPSGTASHVVAAVKSTIHAVDADLPVRSVRTLGAIVGDLMSPQRQSAWLLGVFAAVSLLLSALGTYGIISYWAGVRMREVAIRFALGAQPSDIRNLIVGRGLTLTAIGLALGIGLGMYLARFLRFLLYGVSETDLLTTAAVSTLLTCTALVASYLPARAACRIDPVEVLRYE